MKKVLEILEKLKNIGTWEKWCLSLPRNTKINEAIAELEEAMKPKTCATCKKYHKGTYPDDCYCDEGVSLDEDFQILEDNFYCNRYEPKKQQ